MWDDDVGAGSTVVLLDEHGATITGPGHEQASIVDEGDDGRAAEHVGEPMAFPVLDPLLLGLGEGAAQDIPHHQRVPLQVWVLRHIDMKSTRDKVRARTTPMAIVNGVEGDCIP